MKQAIEGVYKRNDWGDSVLYGVACSCGDNDHDHNVWVEANDTGVNVTVYTEVKSQLWKLNRWQQIWRLLTRGYVEYEATIAMSEQQALNYADTLTQAVKNVKQFQATKST